MREMRDQRDMVTEHRARSTHPLLKLSRSSKRNIPHERVATGRTKTIWSLLRRKKVTHTDDLSMPDSSQLVCTAGIYSGIPVHQASPDVETKNAPYPLGKKESHVTALTSGVHDDDSLQYRHQHGIALPVGIDTNRGPLESLFRSDLLLDENSREAIIVQAANRIWENYLACRDHPQTTSISWLPESSSGMGQDPNIDTRVKDAIFNMANALWVKHSLNSST